MIVAVHYNVPQQQARSPDKFDLPSSLPVLSPPSRRSWFHNELRVWFAAYLPALALWQRYCPFSKRAKAAAGPKDIVKV